MPRLKAFDHDVGGRGEAEKQRAACRLRHVQRNTALVRIEREKRRAFVGMRLTVDERRLVARRVAPVRRLHFDGVGALVREKLGAKRAGWSMSQLQHFHFAKYSVHPDSLKFKT